MYTRDDLLRLRPKAPPIDRNVRKVLFGLKLWLPRRLRNNNYPRHRSSGLRPESSDTGGDGSPNVNNNGGRSGRSTRSVSAACLNVRSIKNKTALITDIINEHRLDIFGLCETFHESHEDVALRRITPPGYRCIEAARKPTDTGRTYGGIAVVYRDNMSAKPIVFSSPPTTFEISASTFSSANTNFIFVVVYRPGSAAVRELFFTELANVFDALATFNHHVIITGDFNIRVNDGDDKNSRKLAELLQSCGFVQSVVGPTHTHGNTLDLVITRSDLPRPVVTVDLPRISDHSLIRIELSIPRPPLQFIDVSSRAWKSFDSDRFRSDLLSGPLCPPDVYNGMSIDQLQDLYDTTLSTLLEKHAPRRTARRRFQPLTPWFDSECAASKRRM